MPFTPRTGATEPSDIRASSSAYNNPRFCSANGLLKNHNSNTYQCTYYAISRLCEIAGDPVTSYRDYPSMPDHPIFERTGFGNGKEWINDTIWETGITPQLGAVVCYGAGYPNDGGNGHVQIVEQISGDDFYVSENQGCFGRVPFLRHLNINSMPSTFQGFIYNPYVHGGLKNPYEVAWEVIKGYWGKGADRKERLEAAGYNYQQIQNIVNSIYTIVRHNR